MLYREAGQSPAGAVGAQAPEVGEYGGEACQLK